MRTYNKEYEKNTSFSKTYEDPEHGRMWNEFLIKFLGGTEVRINDKKYNETPGIQNVLFKSCILLQNQWVIWVKKILHICYNLLSGSGFIVYKKFFNFLPNK